MTLIATCTCDTVRKLPSGSYRLYSRRGKSLGTYRTRRAAERRERQVRYFRSLDATPRRVDPTGTGATRRRWERDLVRRMRGIRALMRKAVVELDVLGLRDPQSVQAAIFGRVFAQPPVFARVGDAEPPPPRAFAFSTSGDKVTSFMNWLYEMEREGILETRLGTMQSTSASPAWWNVYVDTAFQKGIRDAEREVVRRLGGSPISGAFAQPMSADRIGLIYARVYRDLEGITDAMDLAISRELARGIAEGRGVMSIAESLADVVDKIGIVRARTLARTEVIAAHAEGALSMYEEAGVRGVEADVEFATAGDSLVCPICESLQGRVYSPADARGVIPVHPNCRCAWLPVVK